MRRVWGIAGVCLLLACFGISRADNHRQRSSANDGYVEDVYYWADLSTASSDGGIVPTYNPRAREIIFIDDTASEQHPDTVRAIIREAP